MGTCISYLCSMGNRRSSHSSLEDDSRKGSQTSSNVSTKPRQADKHHSNTKSEPLTTSLNPGPAMAESPSPKKQPPDKPPTSAKSRLPDLSKFPEDVRKLLLGHSPGVKMKSQANVVRIYVSSIQDDSEAERAALMDTVFPKLREYAATKGVELHVVDPHWGVWDPKLDDERTVDLCKEEIDRCQRLSIGPNFVTFLNQKYGRLVAPCRILASAFDRLLKKVGDMKDKDLLMRCYKLDQNAVPAVYVLQGSSTPDTEREKICQILRSSWSKEEKELYLASVGENEIEKGVFSPHSQSEGVIWVHRHFTNISHKDPAAHKHLDIGPDGEIDSFSQEQLVQLSKRLATKVGQSNFLKFDIPWNSSGLDPDGIESHRKYLEEFCSKIHDSLKDVIDKAITEEEEREPRRIDERLYEELQRQSSFCQQQTETFHGQSDILNQLESYLSSGKSIPLILHGGPGCGKTSIAAMCTKHVSSKTACVVRFVGTSLESQTINQIFRSACDQIACLYGGYISITSGGMEQLQMDLLKLLDRVTADRPLLLILDGVDQLEDSISNFDWLPKVLPPHVKMILTCNSNENKVYSSLKSYLGDSAIYLEVTPLKQGEVSRLTDLTLKSISRTVTEEQSKRLKSAAAKCSNPLYVQLACYMAGTVKSYTPQEDLRVEKDVTSQINSLFDFLESRYGKLAVAHTLSYVTACRYGIRDGEMMDVLSCDDKVLDSVFANSSVVLRRVPSLLWTALSLELKWFLIERTLNQMHFTTWKFPIFAEVVCKRYMQRDVDRKLFNRNLQDYFQSRWSKKKKPFTTEGGIEAQVDRFVLSQPDKYENYANIRKFQELPFQAFHAGEKDFAKKFIWNADWLSRKMQCCSVYEFISDIALASATSSGEDPDLVTLRQLLELSAYALTCNGAQLFPHLQKRIQMHSSVNKSSHPKISKLLESAVKYHILKFFLSDGCLKENPVGQQDGAPTNPAITGLFRMRGNPSHMLSLSTSRKEIIVWNILSHKAVRTLKGVESPRDVRFIDEHRVVVLCNRELKIFNLELGTFETKLKGIMNVGMPYFSLHDKDHVVALARNRMNVNIINVESGDIVSTFKAGEDRFINSLLVSDNGLRCVCGDETQKPSPLLVWDLQNRKLIHDFRIQQHEFVTKMAAISSDGHYVVSVIRELEDLSRNFVIVYDLQSGQLFKKWKPPVNTTCVDISSEGMCVINGCEDAVVLVWDLVSGSLKHRLLGHTHPVDTLCLSEQGTHCLTHDSTNQDRSVILWSLKTGECLACITPDLPISCCQISADGSCAVMGLSGHPEIVSVRLLDEGGKPKKIEDKQFGDATRKGQIFELAS